MFYTCREIVAPDTDDNLFEDHKGDYHKFIIKWQDGVMYITWSVFYCYLLSLSNDVEGLNIATISSKKNVVPLKCKTFVVPVARENLKVFFGVQNIKF